MSDENYFLRRAEEELAAAERATSPKAVQAHHELATRYLTIINYRALASENPTSA